MTEWNARRWDGTKQGHVEAWFWKAVAPDAERAIWLRATIFVSPTEARAEGWAIAFDHRRRGRHHVPLKHGLPLADASFGAGLGIDWRLSNGDEVHVGDGTLRGMIGHGDQRIRWNLRFEGEARPFITLPSQRFYEASLWKSKSVTPYPDLRFSGEVEVNGEPWEIADWRGMQGHNWQRHHAELWGWCHCNQWEEGEDLVIEAVSGRVRMGPVLLPPLTSISVRWRGQDYLFTKPLDFVRARGEIGLRRYAFSAKNDRASIHGLAEAVADDFVGLHYANPDGAVTHCLNAKLARARIRFEPHGEPPMDFRSRGAALEIGTRDKDHGVLIRL
jgi:hypothetical protein